MRLQKKAVSLIIALSMVLSVSVFALEFPDVEKTSKNSTAIDVLSSIGIIRGYDDGQYKPDKEVSRAEMASLLMRVLALSVISSTPVETGFNDVAPDNWAAQDIKTSSDRGIVKGYGDGNFGPDDNVTLEQATKMVVEALGHGSQVTLGEGEDWAAGYMAKARELKLLDNISTSQKDNAPRGVIAQLLYNSLEVDLMKQVTGTDAYQIYQGENFLTNYLKIRKTEGMVVANPSTTLEATSLSLLNDEIILKVTKTGEDVRLKVGAFKQAQDMLGMNVITYEADDESGENRVIQHIMYKSTVTELTVEADDIVRFSGKSLVYYKNGDDSKEVTATVASNPVLVYNGKYYDYNQADREGILKPDMGSVTLVDSGSGYDLVRVDNYENIIVNTVDTTNKKVLATAPAAYKSAGYELPIDDIDYTISFTKDGTASSFSAIKKGQVLSIKKSLTGDPWLIDVKISDKTVSGQITKVEDEKYTILNNEYEIAPSLSNDATLATDVYNKIVYGASGKFYIDAFGKIAYADFSSTTASSYKYAYIMDAKPVKEGGDDVVKIKIYDAASKSKKTYTVNSKCTVDGTQVSDTDKMLQILNSAAKLSNYDMETVGNDVYSQLIRYQLNSSGYINDIDTIISDTASTSFVQGVERPATGILSAAYSSSARNFKVGSEVVAKINADTTIFMVPEDRTEDTYYKVIKYSGLTNSQKYTVEAFDLSSTGVASYAIVYASAGAEPILYNTPILVISSLDEVVVDGANKVKAVGTILATGKDAEYVFENSADADDLEIGDAIRFTTIGDNEIATDTLYKYFDISDALANKPGNNASSVASDYVDKSKYPFREVYMKTSVVSPDNYIVDGNQYFGIGNVAGSGTSGYYGFAYVTPVSKNISDDGKIMEFSSRLPGDSDFLDSGKINSEYTEQFALTSSAASTTVNMPVIVYDSSKSVNSRISVITDAAEKEAAFQSMMVYDDLKAEDGSVDPNAIDGAYIIFVNQVVRAMYIIKK